MEKTGGYPILVTFLLLGDGLHKNVEDRYNIYLSADSGKTKTMLVCSLLDIASLPITDVFLQSAGFLREAHGLKNATLYQSTDGTWNTIHPRWDEELLSVMYNETEGQELIGNKQYLAAALNSIFYTEEDKMTTKAVRTYTTIGTVYSLAVRKTIPIEVVESLIQIPNQLTVEQKCSVYTFYIAAAYSKLGKYQNPNHYLTEATNLESRFSPAWINKGIAFDSLKI